jgi:hypothetical protein
LKASKNRDREPAIAVTLESGTSHQARQRPRSWGEIRREWSVLSLYQRFEASVAFLLTFVIGAVIVVALCRLIVSVLSRS